MRRREPVIIEPDYTDDELYEWIRRKVNAVQDLKWANKTRTKQVENLPALEQSIARLERGSSIKHRRGSYIPALVAN